MMAADIAAALAAGPVSCRQEARSAGSQRLRWPDLARLETYSSRRRCTFGGSLRPVACIASPLATSQPSQASAGVFRTAMKGTQNFGVSVDETQEEQATIGDGESRVNGSASNVETLTVSVISSIFLISPEEWDACAESAAGSSSFNPFISHAFLGSLEESKSACQGEGWLPQHLVAKNESGEVQGVIPLYLKSHSYGEYVFDHSWANAFMRYGRPYYPKLQSCVPFTPATGPRLLIKRGPYYAAVFNGLCTAMKQLAEQFGVSSLHVTFPTEEEWTGMGDSDFLKRMGVQYHWSNRNYQTFDDFLMDLKQSRRKSIRQERKKVLQTQGLKMRRLRGDDIKPYHWDTFYQFYRNTTDHKWGQAYLTREFFHMIGERMGDQVLLVAAEDDGQLVAGALNLIGGDTLFGRNWGCLPRSYYPNLHFEACYYQAIDAAIEWKLKKVEAGAQGEHKIQRGYLPSPTYSCHYICDDQLSIAIGDFLRREAVQVKLTLSLLTEQANPFKEGIIEKANCFKEGAVA
eukprot:SM000095S24990  [mRNA]  locus=s95:332224:335843:+ [translate_table: standard]